MHTTTAKKGPRAAETYRAAARNAAKTAGKLDEWRAGAAKAANHKARCRAVQLVMDAPRFRITHSGLNGERAIARRLRQIERGSLRVENGLAAQ